MTKVFLNAKNYITCLNHCISRIMKEALILSFSVIFVSCCCHRPCYVSQVGREKYTSQYYKDLAPNLYCISSTKLFNLISQGNKFYYNAKRDSKGEKLYIYKQNVIHVIDKEKLVTIESPAKVVYLKDNLLFSAISNDLSKGIIIDGTEFKKKGRFGIDPGGNYFFFADASGTVIYKVTNTKKPLCKSEYYPDDIFVKDGKILLFSRIKYKTKQCGYEQIGILCQEYEESIEQCILRREFKIARPKPSPSPFAIEDLDPWSDQVLIRDVHDHNPDVWYIYDLKIGELKILGTPKGIGLFLKGDIAQKFDIFEESCCK